MSKAIEKRIMELDEIIKEQEKSLYERAERFKRRVADHYNLAEIIAYTKSEGDDFERLHDELSRNQDLKNELEYAQAQEKNEWIEETIMAYDKEIKEKRKALDIAVGDFEHKIEDAITMYNEHFAGDNAKEITSVYAYLPAKSTDEEIEPISIAEFAAMDAEEFAKAFTFVHTEEEIMERLKYWLRYIECDASYDAKKLASMITDLREREERKHILEWALEQRRAEDENG